MAKIRLTLSVRLPGDGIRHFADVLRGALRTLHDLVPRGFVCALAAFGPLSDGPFRATIAAVDAISDAFPCFASAAWREEYSHTRAYCCSSQDARRERVPATHVCDSAHVCLLVVLARAKSAAVMRCATCVPRVRLPHID